MIALIIVLCALAAIALALFRLAHGPSYADRVVALDVVFAGGVALALISGHTGFLDVAIGLALVGFVATIGWARLIERAADPRDPAGKDLR